MKLSIETEREEDGWWLAEVPQLAGVLAYGATADEAAAKAEVLALRVLAERAGTGRGQTFGDQNIARILSASYLKKFHKSPSPVLSPANRRLANAMRGLRSNIS